MNRLAHSSTHFGNWAIAVLPFIEQAAVHDRYDPLSLNHSAENRLVRETMIAAYVCPSDDYARQLAVPGSGPAHAMDAQYAPGSLSSH